MKCIRCGSLLQPGQRFCPICGTPIDQYTQAPPAASRVINSNTRDPSRFVHTPEYDGRDFIEPPRRYPSRTYSDGRTDVYEGIFGIISAILLAIMVFMWTGAFATNFEDIEGTFKMLDIETEGMAMYLLSFIVGLVILGSMTAPCLANKKTVGRSILTVGIVVMIFSLVLMLINDSLSDISFYEHEQESYIMFKTVQTYEDLVWPYMGMGGVMFILGLVSGIASREY